MTPTKTATYTKQDDGTWAEGGLVGASYAPEEAEPQYRPRTHCWHCDRDPHEGPLTQRVANMWSSHRFDYTYNPDEDDSQVVCVGSDAFGPARPGSSDTQIITTVTSSFDYKVWGVAGTTTTWQQLPSVNWHASWTEQLFKGIEWPKLPTITMDWGWLTPEAPKKCVETANLPAKYEPQNLFEWQPWHKEATGWDQAAILGLKNALWQARAALHMNNIPVPETPGIDYKAFQDMITPKTFSPPKKGKKK